MRKSIVMGCCVCAALMLQSCYCSTVCVGDMKKDDPAVCVNTIHNPHFLYGLVSSKNIAAKEYVAGQEDYKVKHYWSFVDGLLSTLTGGIYTPTTTKVYLPAKAKK